MNDKLILDIEKLEACHHDYEIALDRAVKALDANINFYTTSLQRLYRSEIELKLHSIHEKIKKGEIMTASADAEEILHHPYASTAEKEMAAGMIDICTLIYKNICSSAAKGICNNGKS